MNKEFKAIDLHFKGGYVGSYDPLISYDISHGTIYIDNGYYQDVEKLSDLKKVVIYYRKEVYHEDIDTTTYEDFGHETVWFWKELD